VCSSPGDSAHWHSIHPNVKEKLKHALPLRIGYLVVTSTRSFSTCTCCCVVWPNSPKNKESQVMCVWTGWSGASLSWKQHEKASPPRKVRLYDSSWDCTQAFPPLYSQIARTPKSLSTSAALYLLRSAANCDQTTQQPLFTIHIIILIFILGPRHPL